VKHSAKGNTFCEFGPIMKKTDKCVQTSAWDEPFCDMSLASLTKSSYWRFDLKFQSHLRKPALQRPFTQSGI